MKGLALKTNLWWRQHQALQSSSYRITVVHAKGGGQNFGKIDKDNERFFTAQEVADELLPAMEGRNADPRLCARVYTTCFDITHHHIVIDDLSLDRARDLWKMGF
jgi:hypothetical protein